MKKLFMLILVVMAIGFISCEKPKPEEPKDYREKWVGSYECEEMYHVRYLKEFLLDTLSGTVSRIDTSYCIVYQSTINVTVVGDSSLNILENTREDSYEAKIDANGYFFKINDKVGPRLKVEGNFIGDSLYIIIRHYSENTFGATSEYKGKKLKNK